MITASSREIQATVEAFDRAARAPRGTMVSSSPTAAGLRDGDAGAAVALMFALAALCGRSPPGASTVGMSISPRSRLQQRR